jgi:hypothetical protein
MRNVKAAIDARGQADFRSERPASHPPENTAKRTADHRYEVQKFLKAKRQNELESWAQEHDPKQKLAVDRYPLPSSIVTSIALDLLSNASSRKHS